MDLQFIADALAYLQKWLGELLEAIRNAFEWKEKVDEQLSALEE